MRNRSLHGALEAFVADAGAHLAGELDAGADLPFEVSEQPGPTSPLYRYRPLISRFIDERRDTLTSLAAYPGAAAALASMPGLEAYLREQSRSGEVADSDQGACSVLLTLLGQVFAERTDFAFDPDRFDRAYDELEDALYEPRGSLLVLAPVLGVALRASADELRVDDGLSLVAGDALADAPFEAVWDEDRRRPNVLAVVAVEHERGTPPPVASARARFASLLTALRLFSGGGFGLGPIGWARGPGGSWRPVAVGAGGAPKSTVEIEAAHLEDLRVLYRLAGRRPEGEELAWALTRYEMGCERETHYQALTDYLLALRALLEPEGPETGRLCQRLAMICAPADDRGALAQRIAAAVALERSVIAGMAPVPATAPGSRRARRADGRLVEELAGHLRAVLVDVMCGHLDRDLCAVADELLARSVPEPPGPPLAGARRPSRRPNGRLLRPVGGRVSERAERLGRPLPGAA